MWEATEITLAVVAISRVRQQAGTAELLRRQREFFYGKFWDPVTQSFNSQQGAADGSVDGWINILDEVAKADNFEGRYLPALNQFLKASGIEMQSLLSAWAKACDVPPDFPAQGAVEVRAAMRYVNSFRNRFAHVPFPHDPLAEVSNALEAATENLFTIPPLPASHEKVGQSSPLTGAFRRGRCFFHGSQLHSLTEGPTEELEFVFPCRKYGEQLESWAAGPTVHIDSMMRPHILTRVKGLDVCEYTRFRAEANAVLVLPETGMAAWLPDPSKADYQPEKELTPEVPTARQGEPMMSDAIEAIRSGEYDTAISFFERLSQKKPDYHVGWLRLGRARREKAVRMAAEQRDQALGLLLAAADDLRRAGEHIDLDYQALAHYERSKAFFHLARLEPGDEESRKLSHEEADMAYALSTDKKHQTWRDYLQTWAPRRMEAPVTPLPEANLPNRAITGTASGRLPG